MSVDVGALRVLVIDDNEFMRETVATMLREIGFRDVSQASDGEDALSQIEAADPHLIICDIAMKPMDGFQFVEALRKGEWPRARTVPLVFLTGHTETPIVKRAAGLGVSAYVVKPVQKSQLEARLLAVLQSVLPSEAGTTARAKSGPKFQIVEATTAEQRATALALRYQVFVKELGYEISGVDAEVGLADPGDDRGFILIGYDGGVAAGTMAIDEWGHGEMPPSRVANFHLGDFAESFGRNAVFFIRKAAIVQRYRRSTLFMALVTKLAEHAYSRPEARFAFLEASPYLVTFYERLGFRRYAPHFVYEHGGAIAVPLCLVIDDHDLLARVRSPILALARAAGRQDQPDARRYFQERWGAADSQHPSGVFEGAPSDLHDETNLALRSTQAPLFEDIEQGHIDAFLRRCRTVQYRAKDVLIAADDHKADLCLLLRGYVDVTRDFGDRKIAIATCGPGDLLGEMSMLLGTGPSGTVTALTDVEAILIPERVFREAISDSHIAARINLNLARILARRLRVANSLITSPPPL